MYQFILDILNIMNIVDYQKTIAIIVCVILIFITSLISRLIIKHILINIFNRIKKIKNFKWIDVLKENKLFTRFSNLVIPVTISLITGDFPDKNFIINNAAEISLVIVVLLILGSGLKCIELIAVSHEKLKSYPIRGLVQIIKITALIIGGMVLISILIDKSPLTLIGGIGAMTAVISIVFKDAILGFVSGVQLTGNDMIKIGDWIELPDRSANGFVIDLSITTVKVENFDKTITLIPTHIFMSEAFINWRGMLMTGSRRIKRSIFIDATGIRICDEEMIEKFKKIEILKEYIENKSEEIKQHNEKPGSDLTIIANSRNLTNLGIFRIYIIEYLKRNQHINQDLLLLARQLEPTAKGIPLEIYAFAAGTAFIEYEAIQADIFDHLYAVINEFGLKVFQDPSGYDIRNISRNS